MSQIKRLRIRIYSHVSEIFKKSISRRVRYSNAIVCERLRIFRKIYLFGFHKIPIALIVVSHPFKLPVKLSIPSDPVSPAGSQFRELVISVTCAYGYRLWSLRLFTRDAREQTVIWDRRKWNQGIFFSFLLSTLCIITLYSVTKRRWQIK